RDAGVRGMSLGSLSRGEDERNTLRHTFEMLASAGCAAEPRVEARRRPWLLPISAKSKSALSALVESFRTNLLSEESSLRDIAYTAGARRSHHAVRISVVGSSKEEMVAALEAFLSGEEGALGIASGAAPLSAPKVVFVFPGQGSQWAGMGKTLLAEEP